MSRKRKYQLNEHIFDTINTPAKAYWLGYLYADGCVYIDNRNGLGMYQLTLTSKDKEQLYKFRSFLQNTQSPVKKSVSFYSKHLVQTLHQYGIIPNKTYDHSVPVYIPPEPLTRHFWRGCIDGDGTVNTGYLSTGGHRRLQIRLGLNNVNRQLLLACQDYFGKGHISKASGICFMWQYHRIPKTVLPFLIKLYNHTSSFIRLDRKYKKYLEVRQYA